MKNKLIQKTITLNGKISNRSYPNDDDVNEVSICEICYCTFHKIYKRLRKDRQILCGDCKAVENLTGGYSKEININRNVEETWLEKDENGRVIQSYTTTNKVIDNTCDECGEHNDVCGCEICDVCKENIDANNCECEYCAICEENKNNCECLKCPICLDSMDGYGCDRHGLPCDNCNNYECDCIECDYCGEFKCLCVKCPYCNEVVIFDGKEIEEKDCFCECYNIYVP